MFQVPYFLMTYEEILEYKEKLLPRAIKREIYFINRFNDPNFKGIKTIRVLERVGKTNQLNLIAVLVDIDTMNQTLELKYEKSIEEKESLLPENFRPFYPEDIIENTDKTLEMRKIDGREN